MSGSAKFCQHPYYGRAQQQVWCGKHMYACCSALHYGCINQGVVVTQPFVPTGCHTAVQALNATTWPLNLYSGINFSVQASTGIYTIRINVCIKLDTRNNSART